MLTTYSNATNTCKRGGVIDVDDVEGRALIAHGYARAVRPNASSGLTAKNADNNEDNPIMERTAGDVSPMIEKTAEQPIEQPRRRGRPPKTS
jgi:hypothetical protein